MSAAAAELSQHAGHAALLLGPTLAMGAAALVAQWRAPAAAGSSPEPRRRMSWLTVAAGLSATTAVIHASVFPEHLREATPYGVFFGTLAGAQLLWAALMFLRPQGWLLGPAMAGNAALIGLWLATRTVGIPLGPAAGTTEAFGSRDLTASACEAGIIACVVMSRRRRHPYEAAVRR